jgi:hypothetical protein
LVSVEVWQASRRHPQTPHGEASVATDIAKRQADRLRVLRAIWDATDGTTSEVARTAPTIQVQLELSDKELEAACGYLAGEGLIRPTAKIDQSPGYIAVQLTHRGVREMEESLSAPDKPTRHLPSVASVIAIINSTLINSPIQSASPEGHQATSSNDTSIDPGDGSRRS